jgi:hypothetical protein
MIKLWEKKLGTLSKQPYKKQTTLIKIESSLSLINELKELCTPTELFKFHNLEDKLLTLRELIELE